MTQQHHATRTVYRGTDVSRAQFGDDVDEVWPTYDGKGEPKLMDMRNYGEVIATVSVVAELSDELDRVERVRAAGEAFLHFPVGDGVDLGVTLYPADLSTIRRALDAIEREWARLGVYQHPDAPAQDQPPSVPCGRRDRHIQHGWQDSEDGPVQACPGVHRGGRIPMVDVVSEQPL